MKIFSPYSAEINAAIAENIAAIEFTDKTAAEFTLPILKLPFRIGELLDLIDAKPLILAGLKIDLSMSTISRDAKIIDITEKETAILKYLAENKTVVSRDEMIKNIWNYVDSADSKTVENHIYRLRDKIAKNFGKEIIITDAKGYKLIEK